MGQQDSNNLPPAIRTCWGRVAGRLLSDAVSAAVGRRRVGRNAPRLGVQASSLRPRAAGQLLAALTFGLLVSATSLAVATGVASACQVAQDEAGSAVEPATVSPTPDAASAASAASLTARVQLAGLPGVAPPPGLPTPAPQVLGPAAGAVIQVIDVQAPEAVAAEQMADAQGQVRFELPPGQYWVLVPWSDHVAGLPGAPPVAMSLPDGRAVLAWRAATVAAGGTVAVALTIVTALP